MVLQQLLLSVLRPWVKGDQSRVHVYFPLQIWFPSVFQSDMSIKNATPPCLRLSVLRVLRPSPSQIHRERPESLIERPGPEAMGSSWYGPKVTAMAAMGTVEGLDSLGFSHGFCTMFTPRFDCRNNCHGLDPSFEWHGTLQNIVLEFGIKRTSCFPFKKEGKKSKAFFREVLYSPYIQHVLWLLCVFWIIAYSQNIHHSIDVSMGITA